MEKTSLSIMGRNKPAEIANENLPDKDFKLNDL